jgi:dihydroorotase
MATIYKSVLILDSTSIYYKKKVDLRIKDNVLIEISEYLVEEKGEERVSGNDLVFLPGISDLRVHNTLPGGEHREDWNSLTQAALAGGVQNIQLLPTGNPVPQTAENILFLKNIGKNLGINYFPMAPLTIDNKGENFTDLIDLHQAGATGFSHGAGALENTDLFVKCLQYLMTKPVTVYSQPDTAGLSLFGQINEGLQSTLTGLKGIPSLSETLSIKRDLDLLDYVIKHSFGNLNSEFGLHFSCLSTKESVDLIRNAKANGLPVTCSVAVHQLIFNESIVETFDTNTKVFPPYRTVEDIEALSKGLIDGTVDAIVSDHHPIEVELKEVEFDHASFGVIGLQTLLQASFESFKSKDYPKIAKALIDNPNKILKISSSSLQVNQSITGSILDLQQKSTFKLDQIKSKSKNSPFKDFTFKSSFIKIFHS